MGERTGSRIFHWVWSYVLGSDANSLDILIHTWAEIWHSLLVSSAVLPAPLIISIGIRSTVASAYVTSHKNPL